MIFEDLVVEHYSTLVIVVTSIKWTSFSSHWYTTISSLKLCSLRWFFNSPIYVSVPKFGWLYKINERNAHSLWQMPLSSKVTKWQLSYVTFEWGGASADCCHWQRVWVFSPDWRVFYETGAHTAHPYDWQVVIEYTHRGSRHPCPTAIGDLYHTVFYTERPSTLSHHPSLSIKDDEIMSMVSQHKALYEVCLLPW